MASLQGYLLKNKTRPRECVDEVEQWVKQERETREKMKQEKEKAEVRTNSLSHPLCYRLAKYVIVARGKTEGKESSRGERKGN